MTRFLVMGGLARAQRTGALSRRGRAAVAVGILAAALAIGTATAAQAAVGYGPQVTLPFSGVTPYGVAADAAGNVYVADWNNADMVELPAGATSSSQQVTLPFNGVAPYGVAVDAHGDVYAADYDGNRVVELPALAGGGFGPQITLPFTGLDRPRGVAVDAAGDVYVADNEVLELPAGATSSSQQVTLPFDAGSVYGVAADGAGNVYVADWNDAQVLELPAGATSSSQQIKLPFNDVAPYGVAVDAHGDVYAADYDSNRVVELPAGAASSSQQVTLPFTGLGPARGVAVDAAGDAYVFDTGQVLELPVAPVPAVAKVSPASGPQAGGTSVTISGSGFTAATGVSFGTAAATSFSVNSDTSITATAPAGASAGVVDVTVTTPGGTSATGTADQFSYTAPVPAVTGVSPASGPLAGGTSVTITGSGFTGATAVDFGTLAATSFNVTSATSITATVPADSGGAVDVTVTTAGGTNATGSADQYYYLAPLHSAIYYATGGEQAYTVPAGVTAVTVTAVGAHGGTGQGEFPRPGLGCGCGGNGASVTATVAVTPGQRLYVEVGGFGTENINGDGSGTVPGGFNGGGSSVTGGSGGGASDVRTVSCGSPCTASGQGSLASRLVVAGGGGGGGGVNECGYPGGAAGDSSVTGPGNGGAGGTGGCAGSAPFAGNGGFGPDGTGSSGGTGGTVLGDPACPLGNGAFGQGGNASASCFSGNNGGGGGGGWYGGGAGAGDSGISDSGGGGGAGSSFWADGATGTSMSQDTTGNAEVQISPLKTGATPLVARVSPASGPLAGGTSVTITGTGFTGATTVSFGGVAAEFTVNGDTSITATTPPAGSPGPVDVTVTTPNGTSAASPNDQYTYTAPAGSTTASLTDSGGNPIANAAVTFRPASGPVTSATTGSDGTAGVVLTPGTYSVTMYYGNGYQTKTLSVTANGPNAVSFATIAVTVQISDPDSADLAAALVAHAGNTGTFGPKTAVDGNGQVTFQALPGTNSFTGYDAGGYQTRTVTVTGPVTVTFATVAVTVQISDPDGADLAAALVAHAGNTGTFGAKTAVDTNSGQVTVQALPGTNTFTAYDAGGYQTRTVTVTGPVTVTFATVAVTVTVDKNGSPLATALVAHAGNTGTFGAKTAVDGNGQVTFQVLPGTSSFTAWDGSAYARETLAITAATSTSISVT